MKPRHILIVLILLGFLVYLNLPKLTPYYTQLTTPRVGLNINLQPTAEEEANFVGSETCKKCHKEEHKAWHSSRHAKMIQSIVKNPNVVVADFTLLPKDADFTLKDAIYTIGSKFKQRYMIPANINQKEDFRLGNYQWNVQTQKWQHFKPYKYWYKDSYPHNNKRFPTSTTCDGCHFTGYMSKQKRVEPAIACEACHGAGSRHIKDPEIPLFSTKNIDPIRANEVCLQCHMRNRDKRMQTDKATAKTLFMQATDYPKGYEAGKALIDYKLPAPFTFGVESKEFWANGAAKKNRTQGNEYIHDAMYAHGVTCVNCHNPHSLSNTADKPQGNNACMKCHSFGSLIGPHQKSIEAHTHHKASSKGSLCIECHMPKTAKHTGKSPLTVRSHRFSFTTPMQTKAYGMPAQTNACYACHSNKTLEALQSNLEHWGQSGWKTLELQH